MKLNLNGVESSGLKAMDAGTYDATCVEAKEAVARSSGNQMISLKFRITEAPYVGRNVYLNVTILPQTMWKVKSTVEAILGEELPSEDGVDIELDDLLGKECRVKTIVENYEGQDREKVQSVLPIGSATGAVPSKQRGPSLFS